jgi:hypothetical protein
MGSGGAGAADQGPVYRREALLLVERLKHRTRDPDMRLSNERAIALKILSLCDGLSNFLILYPIIDRPQQSTGWMAGRHRSSNTAAPTATRSPRSSARSSTSICHLRNSQHSMRPRIPEAIEFHERQKGCNAAAEGSPVSVDPAVKIAD